jgi:hypothetical protein
MKSQWAVGQLRKPLTLSTASPRWKASILTSTSLPKPHLLSFWSTLHLTGTSTHEASITVKRSKAQKLSFTLAVNLQELVTFTTGKSKLLTTQCPSVTNCSQSAICSAESMIPSSTKLWPHSNSKLLCLRNATGFIADHQLPTSQNHHQPTLSLQRLHNLEDQVGKHLMNGQTQQPWS